MGTTLTLQQIAEAANKRVSLITKEFTDGFEFIKNYPRSVTVFGSARTKVGEPYYEKARKLAGRIVTELHYSVLTGGGSGIMEAANRGAYEAGGNSLGLNVDLPREQEINQYLTEQIKFHYFFTRKVCLSFSAEAYLFFPGGFGTLNEFLEILTLVQTNKVPYSPVILIGESHWRPMENFFKGTLLKEQTINPEDLALYTITDNDEEVLGIIKAAPIRIGLEYQEKSGQLIVGSHSGRMEGPLSALAKKHCVPCEGGVSPFSHDESEKFLAEVNDWLLFEDKEIRKTYDFRDFGEAIDFMNQVAAIAESENHHPDIKLHDFKKVDIKISTEAIGGLSENDFILAAKIDELYHP